MMKRTFVELLLLFNLETGDMEVHIDGPLSPGAESAASEQQSGN